MAPKRSSVGGKRKADAMDAPGASGGAASLADQAASVLASLKKLPDYADAVVSSLTSFLATPEGPQGLDDILDLSHPTAEDRQVFADRIDAFFPAIGDNSACLDNDGPVILRPWMLGWKKELGTKGFNTHDDIKALVTLILLQGMKTDSTNLQGVERLSVEAATEFYGYDILPRTGSEVGIGGVQYIKGWSRSTAFLFVMSQLVREENKQCVIDLRDNYPAIFDSYCQQFAIVKKHSSVEERMTSSRHITLATTSTRKRPNAFNYVFQVMRVTQACGAPAETTLNRWSEASALSAVLGLTMDESKAALNLVKNVPENIRRRLQSLTARHGISRGPVSHQMLASPLLALNGCPAHPPDGWADAMINSDATLELIVDRIQADFEGSPVVFRRTPTMVEFGQTQQRCAAFLHSLSLLRGRINGDAYEIEAPKLQNKFHLRYLDTELDEAVKTGAPDVGNIAAFKVVVDAFANELERTRRERHREMADRVAQATLQQLKLQLTEDWQKADEHLAKTAAAAGNAETLDLAFAENRYNRGTRYQLLKCLKFIRCNSFEFVFRVS